MTNLATAMSVFMAAPATEIEFNCPWCNTRLALSRADFDRERAVLCPRCSNPIDLDIQRRLARTSTPKPQPPMPAARRQVTTPAGQSKQRVDRPAASPAPNRASFAPAPAPKPYDGGAVEPLPGQDPLPGSQAQRPGTSFAELTKPVDINALFGLAPEAPPAPGSESSAKGAPSVLPSGKIRCAACGFENSKIPPEFMYGAGPTCAWCGKPLPS
jgi:hypothetical protein